MTEVNGNIKDQVCGNSGGCVEVTTEVGGSVGDSSWRIEHAEKNSTDAMGDSRKTPPGDLPKIQEKLTHLDLNYIRASESNLSGSPVFVDLAGSSDASNGHLEASDVAVISVNESSEEGNKKGQEQVDNAHMNGTDSTESELSSFDSDSSDIEIELEEIFRKGPHLNTQREPTCQGELTLKDLPPIEDLALCIPEKECIEVGIVSSIVSELVVIQALPNTPALDLGSVLFTECGKVAIGKIFDVFGRVKEPYYSVRFNSEEHARKRGVAEGQRVYCAPKTDYTSYVFVYEMMKAKGSDASWENNHEPPVVHLDYSDDEEERLAKCKQRKGATSRGSQKRKSSLDPQIETSDSENSDVTESCARGSPDGASSAELVTSSTQNTGSAGLSGSFRPQFGFANRKMSHPAWASKMTAFPRLPTFHLHCRSSTVPSHPPGHPPVHPSRTQSLVDCKVALKAARRINRHLLYKDSVRKALLPTPTSSPTLTSNGDSHAAPMLPPEPRDLSHPPRVPSLPSVDGTIPWPRSPILPPPDWSAMPIPSPHASSSTPTLPIPPQATTSGAASLHSPDPNQQSPFFFTPPNYSSASAFCPTPNPSLPVHLPPPDSPLAARFRLPPPNPVHRPQIFGPCSPFPSPLSGPSFDAFVRRGTFPPPLPPPSQPPFISRNVRSFMFPPSSLFGQAAPLNVPPKVNNSKDSI